jgi:hypothetical protein
MHYGKEFVAKEKFEIEAAEKIGIRIFIKKCSNFVQKTPPIF